jgi:hypothetical protein
MEFLCKTHIDLERQGPGSTEMTIIVGMIRYARVYCQDISQN